MVKVKVITPFFAEQTSTHYLIDAEVEVPENLFERHNENGTGFLKEIKEDKKDKKP